MVCAGFTDNDGDDDGNGGGNNDGDEDDHDGGGGERGMIDMMKAKTIIFVMILRTTMTAPECFFSRSCYQKERKKRKGRRLKVKV